MLTAHISHPAGTFNSSRGASRVSIRSTPQYKRKAQELKNGSCAFYDRLQIVFVFAALCCKRHQKAVELFAVGGHKVAGFGGAIDCAGKAEYAFFALRFDLAVFDRYRAGGAYPFAAAAVHAKA